MRDGKEKAVIYKEINPSQRHAVSYLPGVNDEAAYTDEEMSLWRSILDARKHSLNSDYLLTNKLWFKTDVADAFRVERQDSWLFPARYIPKTQLSSDDFIFNDLPASDVKWSEAAVLMKEIGDYLFIRNKAILEHYPEYLNQPLNYFFLDIVAILKNMAMDSNPDRVYENIEYLSAYIRKIEKQVSVDSGSDKVFLYDLNKKITSDFKTQIKLRLDPKELRAITKNQLSALNDYINKINFVLHFSFFKKTVNPHAYVVYLSKGDKFKFDLNKFPVYEISNQLRQFNSLISREKDIEVESLEAKVFMQVEQFPRQVFTKETTVSDKQLYGKVLVKLHQLIEYENVFNDFLKLLDNTGEVIALLHFNHELNLVMDKLRNLVRETADSLLTLDERNSQIYHHKIRNPSKGDKGFIENYNRLHREDLHLDLTPYLTALHKAREAMSNKIAEMANVYRRQQLIDNAHSAISRIQINLQRLLPNIDWDKNTGFLADSSLLEPPQARLEAYPTESYVESMSSKELAHAKSFEVHGVTTDVSPIQISSQSQINALSTSTSYTHAGRVGDEVVLPCYSATDTYHQTILICNAENYFASVFMTTPEAQDLARSITLTPMTISGDNYSNCLPVNFYGQESVICSGEVTTAVFTPKITSYDRLPSFANTLLLATVLWQAGKSVYNWFAYNSASAQIDVIDEDKWQHHLNECYQKFNHLKKLEQNYQHHDIGFIIDEYEYELENCSPMSTSQAQLDELLDNIKYSISCFTPASSQQLQQLRRQFREQLKKHNINDETLIMLHKVTRLILLNARLPEVILKKLTELKLSPPSIVTITEQYAMMNEFYLSSETVYLNEIDDIINNLSTIESINQSSVSTIDWSASLSLILHPTPKSLVFGSNKHLMFVSPENTTTALSSSTTHRLIAHV